MGCGRKVTIENVRCLAELLRLYVVLERTKKGYITQTIGISLVSEKSLGEKLASQRRTQV